MSTAYATAADVSVLAPELATLPSDTITAWLGVAQTMVGIASWGEHTTRAHALLTAHLMTLAPVGGGGAAGVLTSEANGPASRSFAVPTAVSDFDATAYGKAYRMLARSIGIVPAIAINRVRPAWML